MCKLVCLINQVAMVTIHFPAGDVISVLYNEDENWYRAEVLDSGRDRLKVRMFDYGTEDFVTRENIRPLNHLLNVMPQAIRCRLDDLIVPNEHTQVVMNFFASNLLESKEELRFVLKHSLLHFDEN